jgi:acyl-coenzyme A synthetase/AMP-(fatty) acid ligase
MLSWLVEHADEHATAFVRADDQRMSYGSLAMATQAIMQAIGVDVGDVQRRAVAVAVADQAGFVASALAVLESGGVLVPLDAAAGIEAARAQAASVRAVAMIIGLPGDDLGIVPVDAARVELPGEAGLVLVAQAAAAATVIARPTLSAFVDTLARELELSPRSRTALVSSLANAHLLVGQAFATLRSGGALLGFAALADPARQLEALARQRATGLAAPPELLEGLARAALVHAPSPLAYVACAGAPVSRELGRLVHRAFAGARLLAHAELGRMSSVEGIDDD